MIRKLTLKKEREHETNEASIAGNVMRDLIAHVTNDNLIGRKIKSGELRKKMVEPPWKCPDMFTMTTIEMEHFTMEWLELKENPNKQKVILQLHGGGYIGAMRNAYRMFAGLYNEVSKGMSVLTIDYRVAPENPYPAALEDAVSAYQWLLDQGWFAEDIIVAGDSAGGGLAMALCHYLKDYGIQLPCGIVAMSPWTDLMESVELGKKAVALSEEGVTASMVTMNRVSDDPYTIEYGYAEIKNIANEAKSVPAEWINAAGNDVTQELIDYLTPLIQGESNVTYENGLPVYMDVSHLTKHQ